jgi:5'-nucleotidase
VPGTDIHALANGRMVSITPLQLDLTAHEVRDYLTSVVG